MDWIVQRIAAFLKDNKVRLLSRNDTLPLPEFQLWRYHEHSETQFAQRVGEGPPSQTRRSTTGSAARKNQHGDTLPGPMTRNG
jgi:hypothetical protein